MKCPKCGQEDCQVISEFNSSTQGFGFGKGCLGVLCLGPVGLLCGLCGMGKGKSSTTHYWVCNHCGNKFKL